ncbi:hypothetical protein [Mitsuaria sp. 7]|uniref:hypothetical protein n=1 Tax=Mitsuaria sp. 7 TaxID=1658665 RepID=UPI0007DD3C90|nr:hypothetical protein [Mitsuaria sp. 7]ANH66803.1 hypothetical protein ABE85_03085 [Mitsuaria sp. 7]
MPPDQRLAVLRSSASSASSVVAEAGPAPSLAAHRWLAELEGPETWVSTDRPDHHAAFLFDISVCLQGMGLFPAGMGPLVSWAFFDRCKEGRVLMAQDPDAGSTACRRPWLCGFFAYDGSAHIGLGEVREVGGEAHPVMRISRPLWASLVFELAAEAARRCHESCGQTAPDCCRDGIALRAGLVLQLRCEPALAERLAMQHPLARRFVPPPLSADTAESNRQAAFEKLGKKSRGSDYRSPIDLMRVMFSNDDLREKALRCNNLERVARALSVSPTALRAAFNAECVGRPMTMLGAQCLHPELVRGVSGAPRAGISEARAWRAATAMAMFERGEDLADALSRGIVRMGAVKATRWEPPGSNGGV